MEMVPDIVRVLDLEPNVGGCIVLDKALDGQEILVRVGGGYDLLWALKFCGELAQTDLVLDKCVGWDLLSGLFPWVDVDRWGYVGFYDTPLVLFVRCVNCDDQAELVFL